MTPISRKIPPAVTQQYFVKQPTMQKDNSKANAETTFAITPDTQEQQSSHFSKTLFAYDVAASKNKQLQMQIGRALANKLSSIPKFDNIVSQQNSKKNLMMKIENQMPPELPPRTFDSEEGTDSDDEDNIERVTPLVITKNSRNTSNRNLPP